MCSCVRRAYMMHAAICVCVCARVVAVICVCLSALFVKFEHRTLSLLQFPQLVLPWWRWCPSRPVAQLAENWSPAVGAAADWVGARPCGDVSSGESPQPSAPRAVLPSSTKYI